ncbi:MAG: hypothetical protein ACR2HQ_04935 [Ilumatobacteraceae bacterium]
MDYDAFISYSHAADGQLAPRLQDGIQRFARPWWKRRALAIFRDQTGLAANPNLWRSIVGALDSSGWFVLMASPTSAASEWVGREIAHWVESHGAARILVVVTDGTWQWDDQTGDIDFDRSTAAHPALRGVFTQEPRHVDLTWARTDAQVDTRDGRFRDAIAELAAPLHGKAKDEIAGDDVRQHRRTIRLAWSAGTGLLVLTVAAVIAGVVAFAQRAEANETAQQAKGERLAALAEGSTSADLSLALLQAVEAQELADNAVTRGALLTSLGASPRLESFQAPPVDEKPLVVANGGVLLTGDGTGALRRYDPATHLPIGDPITALTGVAVNGAFVPTGNRFAASAVDGSQVVIDAATGRLILEMDGAPTGSVVLEFSPDGTLLAGTDQFAGTLHVWSATSGEPVFEPAEISPAGASGLAFHPEGRVVAVTGYDGRVEQRDVRTGELVGEVRALDFQLQEIAYSPDGATLAVSTDGGGVFVIDAMTGEDRYPPLRTPDRYTVAVAFGPDERSLVTGGDTGTVYLWDAASGELVERLVGHAGTVVAARFEADGGLTTVSESEVGRWQLDGLTTGTNRRAHDGEIGDVAVSPDGQSIATAGRQDGMVRIWNRDGALGPALETRAEVAQAVGYNHDGTLLAVGVAEADPSLHVGASGRNGRVQVWSVADRRLLAEADLPAPASPNEAAADDPGAQSVAFSPDGTTLGVGDSSGQLTLWTWAGIDLQLRATQAADPATVWDVEFTPDGERIVTAGFFGNVGIYDVGTSELLFALPEQAQGVNDIAISPDGSRLVTARADGELSFWWLEDGERDGPVYTGTAFGYFGVDVSPDGATLAVGGAAGEITLIDVETRRPLGRDLVGHQSFVTGVEFADDRLVTSSFDGSFVEWDLRLESLPERACALAGRNMTRAEWDQTVGGNYRATCGRWPTPE